MSRTILTVTLNPAVDKLIPLTSFSSEGQKPKREMLSAGGKGINVSRTLKCLGRASLATGILGGESGRKIKSILKKEKIPSDFIFIKEDSRVNITLKDKPTSNRLRIMSGGPTVDRRMLDCFEKRFEKMLGKHFLVVLSGKNANGAPKNYYAHLIRMAKAQKLTSVLDTSGAELAEGLKAQPDIIKPNLHEAEDVLGRKLTSLKKMKRAVKEFHRQGIKVVLLTLADRGAVGGYKDQVYYCRCPSLSVSYEVGCGDAFLAGYIHAIEEGCSFPQALRFATSCGSINCQDPTPGLLDKGRVKAFSQKIDIKKL